MTLWVHLLIGLAAGIHGASYGAYKDTPHESFILTRFLREILIAVVFAGSMYVLRITDGPSQYISYRLSPFMIFVATFGAARVITEFWKLFLRRLPQDDFRIPTRIHFVKKGVINHPAVRLFVSILFVGAAIGIWALCTLAPHDPPLLRGLVVGFIVGMAEAMGGGYKDGAIEGFFWYKFIKSPVYGALGGLIVSGHTVEFIPGHPADLPVLMLAIFGTYRMLLELIYKMVVPDYAPGKFHSIKGSFTEWTAKRARYFLPPYVATWALYLVLATHPGW